jgi:hypothetical protein
VNKVTGELRELGSDEALRADEVELTAEQAAEVAGMEPGERLQWWQRLGGAIARGKSRKGANQPKGTAPAVEPRVAKTFKARATADHRKAHRRKTGKAARRDAHPRVKRHARSRAHRGNGKS